MLTRPPRNNDAYALADLIVTASVIDCYQPQTSLAVKSIPFCRAIVRTCGAGHSPDLERVKTGVIPETRVTL